MQTTQAAFGTKSHRLAGCSEIAPLLVFYACDEIDAEERKQVETHLATCLDCTRQLREEQELDAALVSPFEAAQQMEPSGELLAQCRSELCEVVERERQCQLFSFV